MSRETHLLFGILALQLNFISREQLLECTAIWMARRGGDLGKMLLERGHLQEFQHAAVQGLVEAQLRTNEGDARKTVVEGATERGVLESILELKPPPELSKTIHAALARSDADTVKLERPEGRYKLGDELGHGGLGRVLEAFDSQLKRSVALKVMIDGRSADQVERFVREAELGARLEHPAIVPIYDFGELPGKQLFLCMKKIRGRDLKKVLEAIEEGDAGTRQTYSRVRLLRILQDVCLGMAFAHDRGVIHRDLKPANVMIGDYGETLIVDWGLARVLADPRASVSARASRAGRREGSSKMTQDGELIGTPAYMSPEQADGRIDELDLRTDVYSLGAILYEMLTLHPPFQGKNVYEVLARVREGRVTPPSSRIEGAAVAPREPAAAPSTKPAVEPIPPELDAICLKALSLRREDRQQSAKALHDEIQAFLEGVTERERRQKESREHMDSGVKWFTRYRELQAEIHGQTRVVAGLVESLKPQEGTDHKRPLWEAEARLRALRVDRINAFSTASADFARALTADPGSIAAADLNCDLFYHRHVEAERRREAEEALRSLNSLKQFDRKGHYQARLKAPGRLSIRTFARACRCLNPADHPEWHVVFSQTCTIPWRDGRARPDLPLAANDTPVPGIRILPQGLRWGHGPECVRKPVAGIPVTIARLETVDKRLTLGAKKSLGTTPVENAEIPPGAWMCFLQTSKHAPLRMPVLVTRGEPSTYEMNIYRIDEIPDGYAYVPGGPFTFGGEWAGGGQDEIRRTEDVFVSRFPVTCQQYLEYLNDLCAQGRMEEAQRRQPHDHSSRLWVEEGGKFAMPRPSERAMLKWNPQMPVVGVSWFDALAWCQWRSEKEKRLVHLMHEDEYEKACRGVDGRAWSWGDEYDPSFSMTNRSFRSADRVGPVHMIQYPADESPYGVRGLSGNVMTWCVNALAGDKTDWRPLRGGAWSLPPDESRAGSRHWTNAAHDRTIDVGFRTVVRPMGSW